MKTSYIFGSFHNSNSKSLYLTTDAFVNSLFSRLAGCRLLHPLFQWHLGSELQPDVSVRQWGSVWPTQWKLHLFTGLEGGAVQPTVSREYGVTPAKAPGLRVRRQFISTNCSGDRKDHSGWTAARGATVSTRMAATQWAASVAVSPAGRVRTPAFVWAVKPL